MSLRPTYPSHTQEELSTMEALDLLKTQVTRTNALESRLEGLNKLELVATVIGANLVQRDMVPWLLSQFLTTDKSVDEDEILLCLANQLGKLGPFLGTNAANNASNKGTEDDPLAAGSDSKNHAATAFGSVLQLLEHLCGIEETVVRDATVRAVHNLLHYYNSSSSGEDYDVVLINMCKRMVSSDWFPQKVCAAGIFPAILRTISSTSTSTTTSTTDMAGNKGKHHQVRQFLHTLSLDENPLVRRSCAKHLAAFIETCSLGEEYHEDVLPIYRALVSDESDTVRLLAIAATPQMSSYLKTNNPNFYNQEALQVVRGAVSDGSWRVRDAVGKAFGDIVQALAPHVTYLCTLYATLLSDAEAEVRASSVGCLGAVSRVACMNNSNNAGTNSNSYAPIAAVLPKLMDDTIMEVRRNLAREVMDVAPDLDRAFVLGTYKSIIEQLLTDEFPEVQLAVLTNLPALAPLLPNTPTLVSSLLSMTSASNWRVRLNCALMLSSLCEYLGERFYLENLAGAFYAFLLDPVAEVRVAVITASTNLAKVCGLTWCNQHLLPNLFKLYKNPGGECYLTRVTILRCAAALIVSNQTATTSSSGEDNAELHDSNGNSGGIATESDAELIDKVLTFLLAGLEDKVANVRMVAARSLGDYIIAEQQSKTSGYMRVLDALNAQVTDDEDEDCKFFCQLAINATAA